MDCLCLNYLISNQGNDVCESFRTHRPSQQLLRFHATESCHLRPNLRAVQRKTYLWSKQPVEASRFCITQALNLHFLLTEIRKRLGYLPVQHQYLDVEGSKPVFLVWKLWNRDRVSIHEFAAASHILK